MFVCAALVFVACSSGDQGKSPRSFKEVTESTLGKNHSKAPSVAPGFDGETISLGVVSPLSGLAGFLGSVVNNGAKTYWDAKNALGGVGGKYHVELITKDSASSSGYDKTLSIQAYKELEPKVVAFQQVLGTDVVLALKDQQFKDEKIIMPATLSGAWVRDPLTVSIANTYQYQAINGVGYYFHSTKNTKARICSLALDDSYGEDGVEGVEFITKKLGLNFAAQEQFTAASPVSSQVDNLVSAKCDAVVVVATAIDIASVLSAFAERSADIQLIGLAAAWIPEANIRLTPTSREYAADHLWIVSAGAKWGDESVEGVAKMMKDIKTFRPEQTSNPFFMYGYTQAWAMDQILEKALENGDLSTQGVSRALANVGTFDFQGLLPSYEYGPNTKTRVVPPENTVFKYYPSDPSKLTPVADDAVDFASEYTSQFIYK